jgi:hypothetical protein
MSKILRFTPILAALVISMSGQGMAEGGDFGLGIILGEPTGVSGKLWISGRSAIDGAAAWSLDNNEAFHLHGDYLLHNFSLIKVEKGRLPLYYGIGGRIRFADVGDDFVGIRIPVGLEYLFYNAPLDLFIEVVPILDLAPDTDFDLNAALGMRYFF